MTKRSRTAIDHIEGPIRRAVVWICWLAAGRFGADPARILGLLKQRRESDGGDQADIARNNDARILAMALVAAAFPQRDIAELSRMFRRNRQSMLNAIGVATSPRFRAPWASCAKALKARNIVVPELPPGWRRPGPGPEQRDKTEFVPTCSVPAGEEQTEQYGTFRDSSDRWRGGGSGTERNTLL